MGTRARGRGPSAVVSAAFVLAACSASTDASRTPAFPIQELILDGPGGMIQVTWTPFETYVDYWGSYVVTPDVKGKSSVRISAPQGKARAVGRAIHRRDGCPPPHRHSGDKLERSVDLCQDVFGGRTGLRAREGLAIGVNVEIVSIRKVEIDASVELYRRLSGFTADTRRRT